MSRLILKWNVNEVLEHPPYGFMRNSAHQVGLIENSWELAVLGLWIELLLLLLRLKLAASVFIEINNSFAINP